jgi:hypothetical protein
MKSVDGFNAYRTHLELPPEPCEEPPAQAPPTKRPEAEIPPLVLSPERAQEMVMLMHVRHPWLPLVGIVLAVDSYPTRIMATRRDRSGNRSGDRSEQFYFLPWSAIGDLDTWVGGLWTMFGIDTETIGR